MSLKNLTKKELIDLVNGNQEQMVKMQEQMNEMFAYIKSLKGESNNADASQDNVVNETVQVDTSTQVSAQEPVDTVEQEIKVEDPKPPVTVFARKPRKKTNVTKRDQQTPVQEVVIEKATPQTTEGVNFVHPVDLETVKEKGIANLLDVQSPAPVLNVEALNKFLGETTKQPEAEQVKEVAQQATQTTSAIPTEEQVATEPVVNKTISQEDVKNFVKSSLEDGLAATMKSKNITAQDALSTVGYGVGKFFGKVLNVISKTSNKIGNSFEYSGFAYAPEIAGEKYKIEPMLDNGEYKSEVSVDTSEPAKAKLVNDNRAKFEEAGRKLGVKVSVIKRGLKDFFSFSSKEKEKTTAVVNDTFKVLTLLNLDPNLELASKSTLENKEKVEINVKLNLLSFGFSSANEGTGYVNDLLRNTMGVNITNEVASDLWPSLVNNVRSITGVYATLRKDFNSNELVNSFKEFFKNNNLSLDEGLELLEKDPSLVKKMEQQDPDFGKKLNAVNVLVNDYSKKTDNIFIALNEYMKAGDYLKEKIKEINSERNQKLLIQMSDTPIYNVKRNGVDVPITYFELKKVVYANIEEIQIRAELEALENEEKALKDSVQEQVIPVVNNVSNVQEVSPSVNSGVEETPVKKVITECKKRVSKPNVYTYNGKEFSDVLEAIEEFMEDPNKTLESKIVNQRGRVIVSVNKKGEFVPTKPDTEATKDVKEHLDVMKAVYQVKNIHDVPDLSFKQPDKYDLPPVSDEQSTNKQIIKKDDVLKNIQRQTQNVDNKKHAGLQP